MPSNSPTTSVIDGAAERPPTTAGRILQSRRMFFALLGLLFAVHVAVRVAILPISELDESWQIVLSQHWALGYHSHPPLYTWLQIIFFKAFGESIFTLALLKNLLLFGLYLFTYASAKLLTKRHSHAVFATLCLLLIPQIAWESQRDLTHSVLLSTTTAATLFCLLRLAETPSIASYAALGFAAGLALLSKYNSGVFLAGGTCAALLVPRYRALLLDRRVVIAMAACAIIVLPHVAWVSQHAQDAFASTDKFEFRQAQSWSAVAARLPRKVAIACLPNLIPLAVVYVLARRKHVLKLESDTARLLFWGTILSVLILTVGMFATKATALRGRWFQPLFVCAPILLISQLNAIPRWLFRLVASVAVASAISVLVLLPVNVSRGGGTKGQDLTAATVSEVVTHAGDTLRQADVIIADNFWLGGAMRLAFHKPVVTPGAVDAKYRAARNKVAVFQCKEQSAPTEEFLDFLKQFTGAASWRVIYITPGDHRDETGVRVGVAVAE